MAIEFISAVLKNSRSTGLNKFVLVCLANYVGDEGIAFPSVKTLAERCGISESSVHKCMKTLLNLGEVELIEAGGTVFGKKKPNKYLLHIPKEPHIRKTRKKAIPDGGVPHTGTPCVPVSQGETSSDGSVSHTGANYVPVSRGEKVSDGSVSRTGANYAPVQNTPQTGAPCVPVRVRSTHPIRHLDPSLIKQEELLSEALSEESPELKLEPVASKKTRKAKTDCFEELKTHVTRNLGLTEDDAAWLWEKWEGCGWKVGGKAMANWRMTASAWERQKYFPSQKQGSKK